MEWVDSKLVVVARRGLFGVGRVIMVGKVHGVGVVRMVCSGMVWFVRDVMGFIGIDWVRVIFREYCSLYPWGL